MRHVLPLVRAAIALVLFVAALPAVFPVPSSALWPSALLATEWGHGLAALAALTLLACFADPRVLEPAVLAAAALLLGLVPVGQAALWHWEQGLGVGEIRLLAVPGPSAPPGRPFGPAEAWTLYDAPGERPALVVLVSGGPWGGPDPVQGAPALVSWLVEAGLSVAVLPPPSEPTVRPHPQLRAALTWLQELDDAPFDASRPVLAGRGEVGRQLALLVQERPSAYRGLLLSSAPTDLGWAMGDLSWIGPLQPAEGVRMAIGEEAASQPEALVASSPALQRWAQFPPTLILHGGRDPWVSSEHAHRLRGVLADQGGDVRLLELPWALPGFELAATGASAWVAAPVVRDQGRRWASTP